MALESKDLGRGNLFGLGIALDRLASATRGLNWGSLCAISDLRSWNGTAASVVLLRELGNSRRLLPSVGLCLGRGESCNDCENVFHQNDLV